jgi:glycosyltransferase involved in cell wall biosynthesis
METRSLAQRDPPVIAIQSGAGTVQSVLIVRSAFGDFFEPAWNRALNDLGVRCEMFDTHARIPKTLMGRVEQRLLWGPHIRRVNQELLSKVEQKRPDVTLLYQGHHYWPETVRRLRQYTFVAGYHNDDLLGPQKNMLRYRHVKRALPYYQGYHVFRDCNVPEIRQAGVDNTSVLRSFYLPWMDYPRALSPEDRRRFECDLVFAGHYEEDDRAECLAAAARKGASVYLYGLNRYWGAAIPRDVRERIRLLPPVYGEDYQKALCGARIAACFLSKWNRDQYTIRVFEIPACGVFLLSERTETLRELYEEGKEADYFSSAEEFSDKLAFYLANPQVRQRIAEAGHRRAASSGYDIHSRMRQWLRDVAEWSGAQRAA